MLQLDLNMLLVTDIKTKHTDLLFRLHNCFYKLLQLELGLRQVVPKRIVMCFNKASSQNAS